MKTAKSRPILRISWGVLFFILLTFSACPGKISPIESHKGGTTKEAESKPSETGKASYYGKKFHGKKTASGERYDMHALTAAHRTLAFGTKVEVINLKNDKSVTVRINDRGPAIKNRIIDLSYRAAKEIGMIQDGVTKVSLRLVSKPKK